MQMSPMMNSPEISAQEMRRLQPHVPPPPQRWNYGMDTFDIEPQLVEEEVYVAPVRPPPQQRAVKPRVQRAAPAPRPPPPAPVSPPRSLQKVGVGLQLEQNVEGAIEVRYVVPGFAAHDSGLFNVLDTVVSINGRELRGLALADVKKLTIGDENTLCTLMMRRSGNNIGTYFANLVRQVPTTVDKSNEECTQAVFKFMSADTDGDGVISLEELRHSLPSWSDAQVRSYFKKMDVSGDGNISREEYEAYWSQNST